MDDVPTDSENVVIKSKTPGANWVTEHTFDPSLSTLQSHVFRFNKLFAAGTTIAVDYANTGTDAIIVGLRYEEKPDKE
jgi:hypothetical protein